MPNDPIIAYALDAAVTDFEVFRPDVVFINKADAIDYVRDGRFDFLGFYGQDPRFAGLWSGYAPAGEVDGFAVYLRKSP